jgi:hypothetical protein
VQIWHFYNWLEAAGRTPAEMALKTRLRSILSAALIVGRGSLHDPSPCLCEIGCASRPARGGHGVDTEAANVCLLRPHAVQSTHEIAMRSDSVHSLRTDYRRR